GGEDGDLLGAVYGEGAAFRSHPFRELRPPLDYARWAYSEEEGDPEVWMGEPVVAGDRAVVEWWAVVVENGEPTSLAGTSWLRFDEDGRVVDQHDYFGTAPGRHEPWPGWGT